MICKREQRVRVNINNPLSQVARKEVLRIKEVHIQKTFEQTL